MIVVILRTSQKKSGPGIAPEARSAWRGVHPPAASQFMVSQTSPLSNCGLHINTITSPIPTKVYKPATVTPRQTLAMTLSGWSLICLPGTALLQGYCPIRIDHA
jgi:hypothetical protein